jgi:hypothetical protein
MRESLPAEVGHSSAPGWGARGDSLLALVVRRRHAFQRNFGNASGSGNLGFIGRAGLCGGGVGAAREWRGVAAGLCVSPIHGAGLSGVWHDAGDACDFARALWRGVSLQSIGDDFVAFGGWGARAGVGGVGARPALALAGASWKPLVVGLGLPGGRVLAAAQFAMVAIHALGSALN